MGKSAPLHIAIGNLVSLVITALVSVGPAGPAAAGSPAPVAANQGADWTTDKRDAFYAIDQGSRIMPLRWIMALKLPDGSGFMSDGLRRYGYLPNDASPAGLPVGFTTGGEPGKEAIGMNCAACHTRQIEVAGTAYRIDGGPAITDFQSLLGDLDKAVERVSNDAAAFADFAGAVLGDARQPADEATLREALAGWHLRHHTLMDKALPHGNPWGVGRVDAVGMIFNRLAGLDLGAPPSYMMEANIKPADAPVRYPFLWNAVHQDKTQWTGFQQNDQPALKLARNIGQVLGVFGEFHPAKDAAGNIDFWAKNSLNLEGLVTLEALMADIGPPRWPWAIDDKLADRGAQIFKDKCWECHHDDREPLPWKTQITPNTDILKADFRALALLGRTAATGVLEGAMVPEGGAVPQGRPLEKEDLALRIVKAAVTGSIMQAPPAPTRSLPAGPDTTARDLAGAFVAEPQGGYEARVLNGVWAAAPYMHNGSVPTLVELLKRPADRIASFKIGPAYDPVAVGLAAEQPQFSSTMTTTDCSDRNSGNSRCGHDIGTDLPEGDKRALLEYLKRL